MHLIIGADISKASFDVAILRPGQAPARKKFVNKPSGFLELDQFIAAFKPSSVTLALEATGVYGDGLALYGFSARWKVFVANPARVKAFGIALGQRNKTDRADALTIAHFAERTPDLTPWVPLSPARAQLRELVRERLHTQDLLLAEETRLSTAGASARELIAARVEFLRGQSKDLWKRIQQILKADASLLQDHRLLCSIDGVGAWTSAVLLSELPTIQSKTKARGIAALFGLCPRNVQSGTSVRQPGHICGQGRRRLSHQMYMPALCALKHNELIVRWAQGLRARGKAGKELICAVIHKLVRLAVGVLKSRKAFDPNWKGLPA